MNQDAKIGADESCESGGVVDDRNDADADADEADDTDDAATATATATAPYSVLPTDEEREAIINDAIDELADIARENILEFKREDFNTEEVVGTWIDSYLCDYFAEITPARSDFSTATAAEADALNEVTDAYIRGLYDDIAERFYEEIAPFRASVASVGSVGSVTTASSVVSIMTRKYRLCVKNRNPINERRNGMRGAIISSPQAPLLKRSGRKRLLINSSMKSVRTTPPRAPAPGPGPALNTRHHHKARFKVP